MLLAIDTATSWSSVALWDSGLVAELAWRSDRNQTAELVPAIQLLFQQRNVAWDAISATAVSLGPGSFNGLRVGLATAKAFSLARNIPVVAVGTLEAMAWPYLALGRVAALMPAGKDVALAVYEIDGLNVHTVVEPTIIPGHEVQASAIGCRVAVVEDLSADILRGVVDSILTPETGAVRRASAVAAIASLRMAGPHTPAALLEPLYLRKPHISLPKGQVAG